jgi:biopolymer transport protein ExbB
MGALAANSAMIDYFVRGGPWMWALLACSVIALTVIIFKLIGLWLAGRGARLLADQVGQLVEDGDRDVAARLCEASPTAVAAVMGSTLAAAEDGPVSPEAAALAEGTAQLATLESGLPVLGTIANVAPLIGFLGTVSGMIRAFTAIAEAGLGEPGVVAGGIGEALITTATGLIVAIPCFIMYSFFTARVSSLALTMELAGTRLVNLLGGGDQA